MRLRTSSRGVRCKDSWGNRYPTRRSSHESDRSPLSPRSNVATIECHPWKSADLRPDGALLQQLIPCPEFIRNNPKRWAVQTAKSSFFDPFFPFSVILCLEITDFLLGEDYVFGAFNTPLPSFLPH